MSSMAPSPQPPLMGPSSSSSSIIKPTSALKCTTRKRDTLRNIFSRTPSFHGLRTTNSRQHLLSTQSLLLSSVQRANPNNQNPLANVHPDILRCLTDYLQYHQIVLLFLTCTSLLLKLGTEYLTSLTSSPDPPESFDFFTQRRHFLILLSEDNIKSRYCDHCYKTHAYTPPHLRKTLSRVRKVKEKFNRPDCEHAFHDWCPGLDCEYYFRDNFINFTTCQSLMKAYRHSRHPEGAHFLPLLEDLEVELKRTGNCLVKRLGFRPIYHGIKVLNKICARIRDGRLIVASQWRVFVPFDADAAQIEWRTRYVRTCGHLYRTNAGLTSFDRAVMGRAQEGLERLNPEQKVSSDEDSSDDDSGDEEFDTTSQNPLSSELPSSFPCTPLTYACPDCPTDYETLFRPGLAPKHPLRFAKSTSTREKKKGKKGIYLIFNLYTDLGECRDMWEEQWNCGPHSVWKGKCRSRSGWPTIEEPRARREDGTVGVMEAWKTGGEAVIF